MSIYSLILGMLYYSIITAELVFIDYETFSLYSTLLESCEKLTLYRDYRSFLWTGLDLFNRLIDFKLTLRTIGGDSIEVGYIIDGGGV